MKTFHYIHLYIVLLIPVLAFGHPNDSAKQFKERIAAQHIYRDFCACPITRQVRGRNISKDDFILCRACDVFESMANGDEILSDEELQQIHHNNCIKQYAKVFKSPIDSEQLISFCSDEADNFVSLIQRLIKKTIDNEKRS